MLLVDDDELIQNSTSQLLELLGHAPTVAANGEAALALLERDRAWDLVILDLNMPGMGGAAALPRIREALPDTPVLLATGRADEQAAQLVASVPGVKLLAKPYHLRDLRRHMEELG